MADVSFISFDNSGHRISFPQWHSNSTNVQRTDNIIKQIASMFASNPNVVSIIAPLNEYVVCLVTWGAAHTCFCRPAGFDGDAVLSVVRQYWYDSYGNIRCAYMLLLFWNTTQLTGYDIIASLSARLRRATRSSCCMTHSSL